METFPIAILHNICLLSKIWACFSFEKWLLYSNMKWVGDIQYHINQLLDRAATMCRCACFFGLSRDTILTYALDSNFPDISTDLRNMLGKPTAKASRYLGLSGSAIPTFLKLAPKGGLKLTDVEISCIAK